MQALYITTMHGISVVIIGIPSYIIISNNRIMYLKKIRNKQLILNNFKLAPVSRNYPDVHIYTDTYIALHTHIALHICMFTR